MNDRERVVEAFVAGVRALAAGPHGPSVLPSAATEFLNKHAWNLALTEEGVTALRDMNTALTASR